MPMETKHVFFSPNMTGALHLGNATILALVAEQAERIGASVIEALDPIAPWNTQYPDVDGLPLEEETLISLEAANNLLAVPVEKIFDRRDRRERYLTVAWELVDRGVAVELDQGTVMLKSSNWIKDETYGRVWDYSAPIVYRGEPYSSLVGVVDSVDYDVPVWIDDISLMVDALAVRPLWELIGIGPMPRCVHIPTIVAADGSPLAKRHGVRDCYRFDTWAAKYADPAARRKALCAIVSDSNGIIPAGSVRIDEQGHRVGVAPVPEIGQYEDRERLLMETTP